MDSLPVVDIAAFLNDPKSEAGQKACKDALDCLRKSSCLIIKDPRVREQENSEFLDLVEKYFSQTRDDLMKDVHPEFSYQVGATPEFTEVPRDHTDIISHLTGSNAAHKPKGADAKWRFFWRVGDRPASSEFPELNAPPVVPGHFPQWTTIMDRWGAHMLSAVQSVARMVATAYGWSEDTLTKYMEQGPHLLAPTGSDLAKFHDLETIFAGFHYDFNLLTIHGKSRFPGLFIWLRDGSKMQVRVPDGCLLLQAGKQMEWLTGGDITAGFHEVVVCDDTLKALQRAKDENRPLWRISSTLFAHVASDKQLKPLYNFETSETLKAYPPTLAGKQAEDELAAIALGANGVKA